MNIRKVQICFDTKQTSTNYEKSSAFYAVQDIKRKRKGENMGSNESVIPSCRKNLCAKYIDLGKTGGGGLKQRETCPLT